MPSHLALPTIRDHLQAYNSEIGALHRQNADTRSGAGYDIFGGTNAVLFTREATRDRDLFRAVYFDDSSGDEVDELILDRYSIPRIDDAPGAGQAIAERHVGGVAGSFLKGTRILVSVPGAEPRFVEVTADTPYLSAALACVMQVQDTATGSSSPLSVNTSSAVMRFEDVIDDSTWFPTSLYLNSGTNREKDAEYKARAKSERLARRTGYAKSIADACEAVGAEQIALYSSDALGEAFDHGINRCFVGFSSFASTPDLVTRCRVAVDAVRVLGADLVVMGMQSVRLVIRITLRLWVPPNARQRSALAGAAKAALVEYFNDKKNAYAFRFAAMRGAVLKAMRTDVQSVDFEIADGTPEPVLADATFTDKIARYFTTESDLTTVIEGPV